MKKIDPLTILSALASCAGFVFAAVSTSDFVAHLDRQVHGIHCSFLPGMAAADQSGESGCHATLMSPYSSVFRETVWGGIPVALPAMPVFAFLAFVAAWLVLKGLERDRKATGFLFAATLVPLITSLVMGYLSFAKLDAACKLCIGIYASSFVASMSALLLWLKARRAEVPAGDVPAATGSREGARSRFGISGVMVASALGGAFVLAPVAAFALSAPDFSSYVGSCGSLPHFGYDSSILVPLGPQQGRAEMLEVMDPLCPSCKGFEERWAAMGRDDEVDRMALLFPLDESCNWMIDRSIHPGACSVSEAVLCSTDPAPVLSWAFENQKAIMEATTQDPSAAQRMAKQQFPALASCIGSSEAKAKVNQSLRWAVKNQLQVLTPQVFVNGWRLCGEDTDLGLDFALSRLIKKAKEDPRPREEAPERAVNTDVRSARPSSAKKAKSSAPAAAPSEEEDERGPDVEEPEREGKITLEDARKAMLVDPDGSGEDEPAVAKPPGPKAEETKPATKEAEVTPSEEAGEGQ